MKKTFKEEFNGQKELAEESMKQKNGFDATKIKTLSEEKEIFTDVKNRTTVSRIEFEGEKYLSIRKYYKKATGSVWLPGKGVWLLDSTAKEVLTKALELYKKI